MLNTLFFLFVSFMQGSATEQRYAPNFSLPVLNIDPMMKKYGLSELKLSNLVNNSGTIEISSVIVIMAEDKNFEQDLKRLKKIYPKITKKKMELLVLYSSKDLNFQQQIEKLNIPFPVMNDSFEVVRGRYAHVQPQFCYLLNWNRVFQKDACSDINDVEKLLK